MPRRTSIALAVLATACSGPRSVSHPAAAAEPAPVANATAHGETSRETSPPVAEERPASDPSTLPVDPGAALAAEQRPGEVTADVAGAAATDAEAKLREQLKRAIDAGDYALARVLLDDVLTIPLIAEARVLLERGQREAALSVSEKAVSQAPGEARALLVHGEAALQVGIERRDDALLEHALASFMQSGTSASALFGASRASRALGRTDDALRQAREGWRTLDVDGGSLSDVVPSPETPERTLAEATWNAWSAVRATGDERSTALFADAEQALKRSAAREPLVVWGWTRLAELYRDVGRRTEERAVFERAIAALPRESSLYEGLAACLRASGDTAATIACFEMLQRSQPQAAWPWWFAAEQRFELAVSSLTPTSIAPLRTAEREFAACRQRGGAAPHSALEREALCRVAVGWCLLQGNELEAALAAFESSEQLVPGGKRLRALPAVGPAVEGIAAIARTHAQREDLATASELYSQLHRYDPRELRWARLAAETHCALGEQAKLLGDDCVRASDGKINDARRIQELRQRVSIDADITSDSKLRAEFKRKSKHWLAGARQQFEISFACYLDALALAPDDLRLLNECASIPVYHLGTQIDRAEQFLRRAVTVGEKLAADASSSESERLALREAWGDAHQNLGKLYLEHRNDPAQARVWFLRSVEIGPYPRPEVTNSYLPRCEKLLQDK